MQSMRSLIDLVESTLDLSSDTSTLVSKLTSENEVNLSLSYSRNSNSLTINKIIVPDDSRNKGVGSKVTKEICDFADSKGVKITLTPSSDFGGKVSKLIAFYSKFGFVQNKGRNKDFEISDAMYRLPK